MTSIPVILRRQPKNLSCARPEILRSADSAQDDDYQQSSQCTTYRPHYPTHPRPSASPHQGICGKNQSPISNLQSPISIHKPRSRCPNPSLLSTKYSRSGCRRYQFTFCSAAVNCASSLI